MRIGSFLALGSLLAWGFWGDWHTVVLFTARMSGGLRFGAPEVLTVSHPAVAKAADLLGMPAP